MSIWRNQHLEHIIVPKPFITPEEGDFITELTKVDCDLHTYYNI